MKSISEQVIDAIVVALTGIAGVDDRVFRSRVQAVTRDETPCIVVLPSTEESTVFTSDVDENRLPVFIEITTRGDPYDLVADPIAVEAHRRVKRDSTLAMLAYDIRRKEKSYEAHEADLTVGCVTLKFEMRYLTAAGDASVAI